MAEKKQNGKKETKHVNNAESKNQRNKQKKIRQKKGRRHFLTCAWMWKLKNMETQIKTLKAGGGRDENGLKHVSESPAGVHGVVV